MKYTSALTLGFLLATFVSLARGEEENPPTVKHPGRPNIVFIISDDDDYENFGFVGNELVHTPNLDRLARMGTIFTDVHCPAPLCRPSLASILSGRLPHQHGIYTNYLYNRNHGNDEVRLDARGSLTNLLKQHGYKSYVTGKYWEGEPAKMGFTHGNLHPQSARDYRGFVRKGQDDLYDFIKKEGADSPLFIWWAPLLPHLPHNAPQKYVDLFMDKKIPVPPYIKKKDEAVFKEKQIRFLAAGAWFDDEIGQFFQNLKDLGEYENTIILFYVDNGWTLGKPAKSSPYEKGLRTPMFVTSTTPGKIPRKTNKQLQYALDLYATTLDYAGIPVPKDVASQSLRPVIEGKSYKPKEAIFGAVYAHEAYRDATGPRTPENDVYALYARTKKWKYILYTQAITPENQRYITMCCVLSEHPMRRQGHEELYDLAVDPYEMNNLADKQENGAIKAELRKKVFQWWKRTGGKELRLPQKP